MSQNAPAQYLISLCSAAQESGESFGIARRIGSSNTKFSVPASKVIYSILSFSPAPDMMAIEFLKEMGKVKGISFLVTPVLRHASQLDCSTWAKEVMNFLSVNFTTSECSIAIKPVTDLATEVLSHLLIATRNPGRKKTPQDSAHPTPDINRLRGILELLQEATTKRSRSALKELLFRRDGFFCPFTGSPFKPPGRHVIPRSTHILPFSFHNKHLTLKALETFTGRPLVDEVINNINHPCNAFNAESDAHDSYHKLAWGIEAVQNGDQWKYLFREIRSDEIPHFITLADGDEIIFRCGPADGHIIDKPNPDYCNIKLAVARAIHACGAADIIAEMYGDEDDDEAIASQPVYLGGPFVSDDALFRRLDDRLCDHVEYPPQFQFEPTPTANPSPSSSTFISHHRSEPVVHTGDPFQKGID